jgi:hypothetical protein
MFPLDYVVPSGPVLLANDNTVTEHSGPSVFSKGWHRDEGHSARKHTAYCWERNWVVLSVLSNLPFATWPWALPVFAL